FFDSVGADDIILRVKDLEGFDGADGARDGRIDCKIPFTVSNRELAGDSLDVTVQTIVIEQGGNNAANWTGPDGEYDFANNISVTEASAKVHLAEGAWDAEVGRPMYEGDRPLQHLVDDGGAPHSGTPVTVSLTDPFEALQSLSFAARTADGSPLDGAMYFGFGGTCTRIPEGGRLVFTSRVEGGQALYTGVSILDADGTVLGLHAIAPAMSLEAITASGPDAGLRFIPAGDNDADVIIDMAGRVTDVRSGDVVTHEQLATVTVIRDAVADKPQDVGAAIVQADGSFATVVAGSTVTVNIAASFGDWADASEAQYLFISRDYLESVSLAEEDRAMYTLLDAEAAATVCARVKGEQGIADAGPDSYFVIEVSRDGLRHTEGRAILALQAKLRTDDAIPRDGSDSIAVSAVAVEYDGFNTGHDITATNAEVTAENNVAVTPAQAHIAWATLEKDFTFAVSGPVYENDQPGQHVGDIRHAGGCAITIASADPSEVIDSLTISYAGADGTQAAGKILLTAGNAVLEIPTGTTLHLDYDPDHREQCVSVSFTDADGSVHTLRVPNLTLAELTSQGLRYVPEAAGNESDTDILVTFTGMARETETDESGVFSAGPLHITVDAVADKPGGLRTDYDYAQYGTDAFGNPHEAIAEGDPVSFRIDTAFRDYEDGSETHYLLINTRYLVPGSLEVLDPATGAPFDGASVISDPATLAAFFAQVKGEPGLMPGPGDAYVLLEVDEAWLARNGGAVSVRVNGTLLGAEELLQYGPQKTPLAFEVKAVAVEHQGYGTASLPDGDLEYSSRNNVAVTDLDVSFTWDVLSGQFRFAAGVAHEDDQPGQAAGDATPAGGAPLVITPEDPTEVFTSLHLSYDNAHGDVRLTVGEAGLLLLPEAELVFTFDGAAPTRITAVTCGGETLAVPGLTLAELTAAGLRYVPRAGDNTDTDVPVTITAETLETTIGTTGTVRLTATVIVDAVADMPQESSGAVTITHGKGTTAILNEATGQDSFALTLHARFDDWADASEAHYIFISDHYLSGVDGLPDGLSHFDGDAEQVLSDAGLGSGYMVLVVDSRYLEAHGGVFDGTLTAHLKGAALPPEDQEFTISIKTGAVEYAGLNTEVETPVDAAGGVEASAANDVALADASVKLHYSRLDTVFTVREVTVSEGDAPNQHTGNLAPAGGAAISMAPQDGSEVFDSLAVSYADGEGALYLDLPVAGMGNQRILLADGAELGFTFRNQNAGATQCTAVTVTTAEGTTVYTLASALSFNELMGSRLRYIPHATSQSDADVPVTFTGVARETATNEAGAFTHTVLVKVDAVADRPEAESVVSNAAAAAGHNALDPAALFDIRVSADFGGDLADGSEGHYLFISDAWLAGVQLPEESAGLVQLSAAEATALCQNAGLTGKAGTFFVFRVDDGWLLEHGGKADFTLLGQLKDPAALKLAEGKSYTITIKAASVEHQGLKTPLDTDLGDGHGLETVAANDVALEDASVTFTFAVADGKLKAIPNQVYEGSQPGQHTGVLAAVEGGAVTLAPADESEVFTELVLSYDPAHGKLSLADLHGTTVLLENGATLHFVYDSEAHPTECLGIEVVQEGQEPVLLSYADAAGRGRDLTALTGQYLRYTPAFNDDDDADIALHVTGTVLETESGATGALDTTVSITVDAVADMPTGLTGRALVQDATGEHIAALPGDDFTTVLTVQFTDYEDGSEAQYLLLTREHLHDIHNVQGASLCGATEAAALFNALFIKGAGGIHAGSAQAAKKYYVLKVDASALADTGGLASISFESTAQEVGVHTVTAIAVAVEHSGYRTSTGNAGAGHGK
ncbi:MAG: hypothetical protein K2J64_00005, partial [Desulfovibrio sp.]|nr:hypothetical protein [Desulfovibrio sp.]